MKTDELIDILSGYSRMGYGNDQVLIAEKQQLPISKELKTIDKVLPDPDWDHHRLIISTESERDR